MYTIKCPQCGSRVRWFPPHSFSQWRTGKRQCPECRAWLEPSNPLLVSGLSGLLFGGLIVSSRYWGFPNEWLRFVTVLIICWAIGSVVIKTLGRYRVLPDDLKDSVKVQNWSRILSVSVWLAAIAITVAGINMGLLARRPITPLELTSYDPEIVEQVLQQRWLSIKLNFLIGYGVACVAFLVCIFASFMRRKALMADQKPVPSD